MSTLNKFCKMDSFQLHLHQSTQEALEIISHFIHRGTGSLETAATSWLEVFFQRQLVSSCAVELPARWSVTDIWYIRTIDSDYSNLSWAHPSWVRSSESMSSARREALHSDEGRQVYLVRQPSRPCQFHGPPAIRNIVLMTETFNLNSLNWSMMVSWETRFPQ